MKVMKTKIFSVAVGLLAGLDVLAQVNYKVTLDGAPANETFYLISALKKEAIAERKTGSEGKVVFEGSTDEPFVAAIAADPKTFAEWGFFLLDNQPLSVDWDEGTCPVKKGSDANKRIGQLRRTLVDNNRNMAQMMKEYGEARSKHNGQVPDSLMKSFNQRYEQFVGRQRSILPAFLQQTADNAASVYLLRRYASSLEPAQLRQFLETYPQKDNKELKPVLTMLQGEARKEVGALVTELYMKDLDDKEVRLTDWVGQGKYVLVDFWASWCGPCLREMPNVKAAYEKFHEKGFEIVGVSFDSKKEAWAKCVAEQQMPWPQMSDLKGWKSAASDIYNIKAIPSTLLFDPQGRVVAYDLRGEALTEKLAELLK